MEAIISIKGVIGTFTNPDTGEDVVGMQLPDLVNQLHAASSNPAILSLCLEIDSPGGDKDLGFEMYALLKAQKKPIRSVIVGECYSIATVILFAGETRELGPAGIPPMIHNPWFTSISGDAATLAFASEILRGDEEDLINFYHKNTGVEKSLIASLMKVETYMSVDQAINFKFLTTQPAALKAVAFKKSYGMNKELSDFVKEVKKQLGLDKKAVALVIKDTKGTEIETNSEGTAPIVGDAAMIAGQPAPDGTYEIADLALSIVVVGGLITEVNAVQPAVDTTADAVALQLELDAEKEKNTALALKVTELEKDVTELGSVLKAVALRSPTTKEVVIPERRQVFNKPGDPKDANKVNVADLDAARKARKGVK